MSEPPIKKWPTGVWDGKRFVFPSTWGTSPVEELAKLQQRIDAACQFSPRKRKRKPKNWSFDKLMEEMGDDSD